MKFRNKINYYKNNWHNINRKLKNTNSSLNYFNKILIILIYPTIIKNLKLLISRNNNKKDQTIKIQLSNYY